jgi:hypothetical protein
MPLDFSADELRRVARACSVIRIGRGTPPYLQRFLEVQLETNNPALAGRIAALDHCQMAELCRKVRALQWTPGEGRETEA